MENRKICDAHVHLGRSNGINATLHSEQLDNFIEKFDIENLLLFPFEIDTNEDNKKIKKLSKINKKIHGMYWIQKNQIEKDVKNLNEGIGDGYVGVKFHGTFENLPISDEVYKPVLEVLNEKEALLLVHTGRFKDGDISSNTSFLHAINVSKTFPKIKIILAHMGGNDQSVVEKALHASKDIRNIWFETSGITSPIRVEKALEVIGPERILFGSDVPWCSFRSIFYGVEDSMLDEKSKNMIFYDNFIKLLNL